MPKDNNNLAACREYHIVLFLDLLYSAEYKRQLLYTFATLIQKQQPYLYLCSLLIFLCH
jgi:hypothetical protein